MPATLCICAQRQGRIILLYVAMIHVVMPYSVPINMTLQHTLSHTHTQSENSIYIESNTTRNTITKSSYLAVKDGQNYCEREMVNVAFKLLWKTFIIWETSTFTDRAASTIQLIKSLLLDKSVLLDALLQQKTQGQARVMHCCAADISCPSTQTLCMCSAALETTDLTAPQLSKQDKNQMHSHVHTHTHTHLSSLMWLFSLSAMVFFFLATF